MEERTIYQPPASGSVRPGTRLNGVYEIEKLLAQGGMGEVYRGFNIQTMDIVAIKMIRPEFSTNPEVFELFRREASILHNLVHEAIVRYFVFSVDPDIKRAYLAMEFVDGPSLTTRLASGPLSIADVRILQRRIASALEAAHQLGIIHRDVSPDNVILPDGDVRRAKIIDFGIARSLRTGAGTIIGGGFAGKYNYVSPEQLGLKGGEVTFKSDIYSFGLVLAESLLGRPLDMNGSQAEIIEKRRAVPDLAGVDPSIRPLIQAMLQPSPADRPSSMAAVAEWGESAQADAAIRARRREPSPARESSGGRAAVLGALIAIASLGGVGYVFREDLSRWVRPVGAPIAAAPPLAPRLPPAGTSRPATEQATVTAALPPLAPAAPAEAPTAPTPLGATEAQQTSATAPPAAAHIPTSAELVDALPPHASQPLVDLPPATVGTPYRAELPGFTDHAGKGLRLAADSPPEGLAFMDLGDGKAAIEGTPTHAGDVAMHIVATNHSGRTAQMTATIVVADKAPPAPAPPPSTAVAPPAEPAETLPAVPASPPPQQEARLEPPRPSLASAVLEGATVGEDFRADLPPFSGGANAGPLELRAEPRTPEGLDFVDLGSGRSRISGKPAAPGSYTFDVVAMNGAGLTARMSVKLSVAPAPSAKPDLNPQGAPPMEPIDEASLFFQRYGSGDCFLVKPLPSAGGAPAYLGVGDQLGPFQRFEEAFKKEVGAEPQLSVRLITPSECPAVDLLRPGVGEAGGAPRIDLADYRVGRNKPLAGTIANLGGRHVVLILVDNEGKAYRVDAKPQPGGDAATFSIPLTPDAGSIGPIQLILAVVSARPIPALETFRSGALKAIAPALLEQARSGSASVGAEFFMFAN